MNYYHVYHRQANFEVPDLRVGDRIELKPFIPPPTAQALPDNKLDEANSGDVVYWSELSARVNKMFPEGLSFFGERIFRALDRKEVVQREEAYEYIRVKHHPTRLSRVQSFFACHSIEEAQGFRDDYDLKESPILEVSHEGQFEVLDMNWIFDASVEEHEKNALSYWAGKSTPSPFREVLLKPPVVVQQIIH